MTMRAAMHTGFLATAEELVKQRVVDIMFSGSTAISVVVRGQFLICANVGDSRAIVGKKTDRGWEVVPLSRDHKPDDPDEQKRIEDCGGVVEPYQSQFYTGMEGLYLGPARVWMKTDRIPGLAMSRSMGDAVASNVGVTAEPELMSHDLTSEDKFLLLASDGVWEFLSSQTVMETQCVDIISSHWETKAIETACDRLLHEAVLKWKRANGRVEEEVIDDITFVLAFFA